MGFFLSALVLATSPDVSRAIEHVRQLDEEAALLILERAKARTENSTTELAEIYLWIGLAKAGLAKKQAAQEAFKAALLLQPTLTLPSAVSPRVESWWREVGGPVDAPPKQPELTPPPPTTAPALTATSSPPSQPIAEERVRWRPFVGAGVLAVGLTSLIIALVFGSQAAQLSRQADEAPRVGDSKALFGQATEKARAANWLFGGAGLAAVGGTLLIVF